MKIKKSSLERIKHKLSGDVAPSKRPRTDDESDDDDEVIDKQIDPIVVEDRMETAVAQAIPSDPMNAMLGFCSFGGSKKNI